MAREQQRLGKERAGAGWRYRKMVYGKTWTSKVYPTLTRQTKAEAWKDFTAFRGNVRAASPKKQQASFFKQDGRTLDEDVIAASGLTAEEASREVLVQLCQSAYSSLAELLGHAGDHEGRQEALSKVDLLRAHETLTHHD